ILGRDRLLGFWVEHLACELQVDLTLIVLIGVLHAHAGEESRETPEVILGPFLPGVVVAPRALEPHSQKDLAYVGGVLLRFGEFRNVIEVGRWVEEEVAGGGQQLGDELVVGLVLADSLANPVVDEPTALVSLVEQTHSEQIAEASSPDFRKFGPLEEV